MSLAFWTVNFTLKRLTRLLCQVEDQPLASVPARGPLILVCNHINFVEVPLMYTHLLPRPVTAFVKSDTWESPWLGPLFTLWDGIPLQRGEADPTAFRKGVQALKQGKILVITPEGTRSGHGRLQAGHPGVTYLALLSGAPLLPLAYYGQEALKNNLRRLQRTPFHIAVGQPFTIQTPSGKVTNAMRLAITDEIMYQLAALLPPAYRGVYADLSKATSNYIRPVHN
jgi:1-acyl-sn-glycerol-3-phosphate acyltransferase